MGAIKLTYRVGRNSKRKHKVGDNSTDTPAYVAWIHMLMRCYCPKYQAKHTSYIGCSVDESWHDFQDFADWFYDHPYSDMDYHLDKDLLYPGNKVYGPDTCCLVPRELNNLLVDNRSRRGKYPQGVSLGKGLVRFRAKIGINGRSTHLGYFDTVSEAYQAYKAAKERYVKSKALEWANRIEWNVFVALMNWSLDH